MKLLQKLLFILVLSSPFSLQATQVFDANKNYSIESSGRVQLDVLIPLKRLNPYAKIALSEANAEAFVTVQDATSGGNSLDILHSVVITTLGNPADLKTNKVQIDGLDAYESEFSMNVSGLDLTYITVDFIKEDKHYLLMGWSYTEKYASYKDELKSIIYSFKFK